MNDVAGDAEGFDSARDRVIRALGSGAVLGLALAALSGLRRLLNRAGPSHSTSKN